MPGTDTAGRAAFRYPDFVLFTCARFLAVAALEMQSVAVGWQIYEITKRPLDLGLVGLAQFFPSVLLFLVSGHAVDRFNRRKLMTACYAGFCLCSTCLLIISHRQLKTVLPIYLVLVLLGTVRSLNGPASRALLPQLVPEEHFPNAVAWNATTFQTATILGPSLGGFLYALSRGPSAVYATSVGTAVLAMFATLQIKARLQPRRRQPVTMKTVFAGLHYIHEHKIILGSISLDMFAVLLGGAVALLPVYAREILHTGPWGLGLLRSAPGVGAAITAVLLAHYPPRKKIGHVLLYAVAGFGVFTIAFGLSRNFILSMVALAFVGISDMVSVFIRSTLVQLATPDEMRGRVNSVEMIFIGASNELGQFESGVTAHWFGTVPAVVIGGVGTLTVIALWAWWFPELRKADRFPGL